MRFHIIEAKKLVGGNLQPVVKVYCGKDVEQTSTQKGSNNPFWDEMLYFNFKVLPKEMLDKVCEIKVCKCVYVYVYVCVRACVCVRICVHMCVYTCMYICACACV